MLECTLEYNDYHASFIKHNKNNRELVQKIVYSLEHYEDIRNTSGTKASYCSNSQEFSLLWQNYKNDIVLLANKFLACTSLNIEYKVDAEKDIIFVYKNPIDYVTEASETVIHKAGNSRNVSIKGIVVSRDSYVVYRQYCVDRYIRIAFIRSLNTILNNY